MYSINRLFNRPVNICIVLIIIAVLLSGVRTEAAAFDGQEAAAEVSFNEYTYGSGAAAEYILEGKLPSYRSDGEELSGESATYEYGSVFSDVNDYYFYNQTVGSFVSSSEAPVNDRGLLIGGNAFSRHDGEKSDGDSDDYNSILPYASLYVDPDRLYTDGGGVEYEFYSDDFSEAPDGNGVIYTGGIEKSRPVYPSDRSDKYTGVNSDSVFKIASNNASYTTTQPDSSNGKPIYGNPLFTVCYKDAVQDSGGRLYNLTLTFNRITFVAGENVTDPLKVLEGSNLCLSPLPAESKSSDDGDRLSDGEDEDENPAVGARVEYDYSIEDDEGEPAGGLLMFAVNDLDKASLAPYLKGGAYWGLNALGNDFFWAEGFGVKEGAASFAVMPASGQKLTDSRGHIYNNMNGDQGLIRVSRMEDTSPDGTANGLYFTTSVTSVSGWGSRNDENTADTGVSMLLQPAGSQICGFSCRLGEDVHIRIFDSKNVNRICQYSYGKGRIYCRDYSLVRRDSRKSENASEDGSLLVSNKNYMKVVGSGTDSTHYMAAEEGYYIDSIIIDDVTISYNALNWVRQEDGTYMAEYKHPGSKADSSTDDDHSGERRHQSVQQEKGKINKATYYFFRNESDKVWVTFENIQTSHSIGVRFEKISPWTPLKRTSPRILIAIFLMAGFGMLVLISSVSWLIKMHKGEGLRQ